MNAFTRPEVVLLFACPECGGKPRKRENRSRGNEFWGCSEYPRCKWTAPSYADQTALAERVADLEAERAEVRGRLITMNDIRDILKWAHPDKHPSGQLPAHEVALRLTELLDRARGEMT